MPTRSVVRPAGLALACAAAIVLCIPAVAGAKPKTVGANLRVVGPSGQTIAEQIQYTGTMRDDLGVVHRAGWARTGDRAQVGEQALAIDTRSDADRIGGGADRCGCLRLERRRHDRRCRGTTGREHDRRDREDSHAPGIMA